MFDKILPRYNWSLPFYFQLQHNHPFYKTRSDYTLNVLESIPDKHDSNASKTRLPTPIETLQIAICYPFRSSVRWNKSFPSFTTPPNGICHPLLQLNNDCVTQLLIPSATPQPIFIEKFSQPISSMYWIWRYSIHHMQDSTPCHLRRRYLLVIVLPSWEDDSRQIEHLRLWQVYLLM